MNTLTTLTGQEIKTFQQLNQTLGYIDGSDSRGQHTRTGQYLLNGEKVTVYRHWSYDGNYHIFSGELLNTAIAEIFQGNWYDYKDADGNQIKCENGIYDLVDCQLTIKMLSNEN